MECVRGVLLVIVLCQVLCGVFTHETENEVERGINMLHKTYQNCEATGELGSCLKMKAIKFADRALKISSIPIFEGVTLVRNDKDGRAFQEEEFNENALPEDTEEKTETLDGLLLDRLTRFFRTHSLQFNVPQLMDAKQDISEARGKYKKYMGPLIIAAMMKGGLFAYAMKAVGLLAAKALLVSKIALVLASVVGLKKLFSSGGAESKTIEIVSKPQISHSHAYSGDFGGLSQGWEPSGHGGSSSGGYNRRSFDTSLPFPAAQELAYQGRSRH